MPLVRCPEPGCIRFIETENRLSTTEHSHFVPRHQVKVSLPGEMLKQMHSLIADGEFVSHSDLVETALCRMGVVGMQDESLKRVREAISSAQHGHVEEGTDAYAILGRLAAMFDYGHPCARYLASELTK